MLRDIHITVNLTEHTDANACIGVVVSVVLFHTMHIYTIYHVGYCIKNLKRLYRQAH